MPSLLPFFFISNKSREQIYGNDWFFFSLGVCVLVKKKLKSVKRNLGQAKSIIIINMIIFYCPSILPDTHTCTQTNNYSVLDTNRSNFNGNRFFSIYPGNHIYDIEILYGTFVSMCLYCFEIFFLISRMNKKKFNFE